LDYEAFAVGGGRGTIGPENPKLERLYPDATITFPIAAAAVLDRVRRTT